MSENTDNSVPAEAEVAQVEDAAPAVEAVAESAPAAAVEDERLAVSESASGWAEPKVDRAANVIRNVKLLGRFSKNVHPHSGKNYRYTDEALSGFARLQEGARVHVNHMANPTDALDTPRGYQDQVGDVRNVRAKLDGPDAGTYGDLHYNPAHPLAEQIIYDAEHAPHRLALSHVATGAGRENGDYHDIVSAESVVGVDVVTHGGTNVSLFESDASSAGLKAENIKLAERVSKLERELAVARARESRKKMIADAGLEVSETLFEVLVDLEDKKAEAIIESMRNLSDVGTPSSRPRSEPPASIKSTDDFMKLLGGR